ncbi:hypothetical protein PTSG_07996 [Salpingoeca rosetta]|uniref:Uncharacterized protein n=1 Tax=Salpingoeca rosetta (strain ATCC 50818 / BSB-021) TaxID=946362 RepID=F2UHP6_SALR5|nr:uncharacterized protein PTSG_07996 [Salpingoeca rosetta]EGD76645.1 hypothetical protein PTSG_07996 [Salpingoeca rosetta]|eukprot:XP_004991017.1 hypothetical protein PTSG_07996 [Salpingoeca rosetta]
MAIITTTVEHLMCVRVRICQADALIDAEREEPIHIQHPHPRMPRHGELCHLNQPKSTQAEERMEGKQGQKTWGSQ